MPKETPETNTQTDQPGATPPAEAVTPPDETQSQDAPTAEVAQSQETQPETVSQETQSRTVDIVMKRELPVGNGLKRIGDKIATVTLEPGVTMEFLGDAYRDSFACVRPDASQVT